MRSSSALSHSLIFDRKDPRMFLPNIRQWFTRRQRLMQARKRPKPNRWSLRLEQLEDRTVPTVLDFTGATTEGVINDAIFRVLSSVNSTGSGVIQSFVRVQQSGTEQGYNSDFRPVQFNELTSSSFNRSLLLSSV